MAPKTCFYIKPEASEAAGREQRDDTFAELVRGAIRQSGLNLLDESGQTVVLDQTSPIGVIGKAISDRVIEQIDRADVVLIDTNCYETSGAFRLSPWLCYFMAFSHSIKNKTLLLTKEGGHLPNNLHTHHTIVFRGDGPRAIQQFNRDFETAVKEMDQRQDKADNPIQNYKNEVAKKHAEAHITDLENEIERLRQRQAAIKEKEQEVEHAKGEVGKITFRKVNS